MPIFARLAASSPRAGHDAAQEAKMVGTIEERSLVALFAQITKNRMSGRS